VDRALTRGNGYEKSCWKNYFADNYLDQVNATSVETTATTREYVKMVFLYRYAELKVDDLQMRTRGFKEERLGGKGGPWEVNTREALAQRRHTEVGQYKEFVDDEMQGARCNEELDQITYNWT